MERMPEVGEKVRLVGKHPCAGERGVVTGYEQITPNSLLGIVKTTYGGHRGFWDQSEVELDEEPDDDRR